MEYHNMKDLLNKAQSFINYEEKLLALGKQASNDVGSNWSSGKESNMRKEKSKGGPRDWFEKYTMWIYVFGGIKLIILQKILSGVLMTTTM